MRSCVIVDYALILYRALVLLDLLYTAIMPLDSHTAVLVAKVRSLRHVAEEADFHDARKHLDASQELMRPESVALSGAEEGK